MITVIHGDFEWDADKAAANFQKHAFSFEEATTVFLDLDYLVTRDSTSSERFLALGFSNQARLLIVVHVEPQDRVRIISARRATKTERHTYEQRRPEP